MTRKASRRCTAIAVYKARWIDPALAARTGPGIFLPKAQKPSASARHARYGGRILVCRVRETHTAPKRLHTLGDEWLDSGKSIVMRVPSAIVVGEFNYLLNPLHPDFSKVRIHGPEHFQSINDW